MTPAAAAATAAPAPAPARRLAVLAIRVAGDALVVSAFIYFTGGVASVFSSLYALPIVAGSMSVK